MVMYISDPKYSTKEFLQLITTFNKVVRCKIKSEDFVDLLHTLDKQIRKEIRKIRSFTIDSNNMKQKSLYKKTLRR